jgi:hypothetical protein
MSLDIEGFALIPVKGSCARSVCTIYIVMHAVNDYRYRPGKVLRGFTAVTGSA